MDNKRIGKFALSLALPMLLAAGLATVEAGSEEVLDQSQILESNRGASTFRTIKFDANGGKNAPSDMRIIKNKMTYIPNKQPTKKGYTFTAWWDSKGHRFIYPGNQYKFSQNCTLVALWRKNSTETNTSNSIANKQSVEKASETSKNNATEITSNKEIGENQATEEIKDTENVEKSETEEEKAAENTEETKEETKVEEKQEEKEEKKIGDSVQETKVYVASFDTNGGQGVFDNVSTGDIPVAQEFGSIVLPKNKPTREGYTFVEWNSERDGSGAISGREGQKIAIDKNYTLYARWAKNAVRTVSFDANGGDTTPANIVTDENGVFVLPDAVNKDGYTFNGWNTKRDGSGYWGNANQRMFISASDTVYAIYQILSEQVNLDQEQEINEDQGQEVLAAAYNSKKGKITASYNQKTRTLTIDGHGNSIRDYKADEKPSWSKYLWSIGSANENAADTIVVKNVKRIGNFAFSIGVVPYRKTAVHFVTLGEGLEEIGYGAFSYSGWGYISGTPNKGTPKVDIPKSVKLIDKYAFRGSVFDEVKFNDNPELTIGDYAFYETSLQEKLELPKGTIKVGNAAFGGQGSKLKELIVPETATIGNYNYGFKITKV